MPLNVPADESTVAHRPAASLEGEWTRLVTVASAGEVGRPLPSDSLRVLLRKRLLFVALLLTVAFVVACIMSVAALSVSKLPPLGTWEYSAIAILGLGAVLALVLWLRPSLSVRQLRAIEFVLFGACYGEIALVHGFFYPTIVLIRAPFWYGFILGYAVSLPWVFLIIGYGILIPNTWRRCGAVVGIMAITPLVISMANGMAAGATAGRPVYFLLVVGMSMAAAVAIAVYGSHRIEVLRQQVVAARRLGQYQLGRRLGAGGMGEVYLAEHLLLRRPCAVKLIRPDRGDDPASLDRFEREVRATAALTHPNTVQVFDYGRADDGTFYYAMEYLPGMTLDELVRRYGPLPPGRAIHFLRQVCGALSEAHAAGMVHRDIKPSNVIVCERGGKQDVAKLLDFGLVVSDRRARGEGIAGTPAYMSPEQASGQPLDARSDLYSLGAVAYFLLTGEPPFSRKDLVQVLAAHRDDTVAFPDRLVGRLPADVKAVVLRCLEKEPSRRYRDSDSLEGAWADCTCSASWTREEMVLWWQHHALAAPEAEPGAAPDPAR